MNAVTYNPGQKNLGHLQFFGLAPAPHPPLRFQICDGGGREDQPGVAAILSGVVGTRRKNTSQ